MPFDSRDTGFRLPILVALGSLLVLIVVLVAGRIYYGGWLERQARASELGLREQWEVLVQWKLATEAELEEATAQMEFFSDQIDQLREREQTLREVLSIARDRGVSTSTDPAGASENIRDLERQIDNVVSEFDRLQTQLESASQERQVLIATLNQAEEQLTQVSSGGQPDPEAIARADASAAGGEDDTQTDPAVPRPVRSLEQLAEQEVVARVQEQTRREQVAIANLQERYRSAILSLLRGDLAGAERDLAGLRQLLSDPEVGSLLAIANRRPLDTALMSLIDQAIADRRSRDALLATMSTSDADLARINSFLQDGTALLDAGDLPGAVTALRSALQVIPAVSTAAGRLAQAEAEQRRAGAAPLLDAATVASAQADVDAQARILNALAGLYPREDAETLAALANQLSDTARQLEASARAERRTSGEQTAERDSRIAGLEQEQVELEATVDRLSGEIAELADRLRRVANSGAVPPDDAASQVAEPGIPDVVAAQIADAFASVGAAELERGTQIGIDSAVGELRLGVGYLDGSLDADREELLSRIESDERIKRAMLEIQELGRSGLVRQELPLGQLRFIGVVGAVAGDRILVDQLTDTEVEPGDTVVLSRRSDSGENQVAVASVLSVERDRVRLQIESLEPGEEVEPQDVAYLLID